MEMKNGNSFVLVLLITFIFFTNSFGQQTVVGIGSGISKAVGEGSEFWNLGYNISLEFYKQVTENILVGGRFAFNRITPDKDEINKSLALDTFGDLSFDSKVEVTGSASMLELLPSIRIVTSKDEDQLIQFFGQFGAGCNIYRAYAKTSVSINSFSETVTIEEFEIVPSINIGAGISIDLTMNIKLLIYPMYNFMFTEDESTKYISFNLGLLL